MDNLTISGIPEFLDFLKELENNTCIFSISEDFLYRGQADESWPLKPKIYRQDSSGQRIYKNNIDIILTIFEREAYPYILKKNITALLNKEKYVIDFRVMTIAQHYGVPTQLLDFTRNPLVALYFACVSDGKNDDKDACVWVLNRNSCNIFYLSITAAQHFNNQPLTAIKELPWIVQPPLLDERMSNQGSEFLYMPKDIPFEDFVRGLGCLMSTANLIKNYNQKVRNNNSISLNNENYKEMLGKLIIKASAKSKIIKELNVLGINEKLIYPGLDGIGRYIDYISRKKQTD